MTARTAFFLMGISRDEDGWAYAARPAGEFLTRPAAERRAATLGVSFGTAYVVEAENIAAAAVRVLEIANADLREER